MVDEIMQNVHEKLKKEILKDKQLYTSSSKDISTPSDCSSTTNSTSSTSSSTGNSITRSSDAYIYGAGSIAVLAIC